MKPSLGYIAILIVILLLVIGFSITVSHPQWFAPNKPMVFINNDTGMPIGFVVAPQIEIQTYEQNSYSTFFCWWNEHPLEFHTVLVNGFWNQGPTTNQVSELIQECKGFTENEFPREGEGDCDEVD
jgi:hypothetical protein